MEAARALYDAERPRLTRALENAGIRVFPSQAGFLLLQSRYPLYERLLGQGILIRSCESFAGLGKDYYRICIRTREENDRLIEAVRRCIE